MPTMSEITTVIVDDLEAQREIINKILFKHNEIVVVSEADGMLTGFKIIKKEKPQLAFIDIGMEDDDSGIQLAKKIKNELSDPPIIVFMSCNSQDSTKINGIHTNQLCFLKKPITSEDISEIIFAVKTEIDSREKSLEKITIAVQRGERVIINPTIDILYIKKEGDYCILVLKDERELKTRKLLSYFVNKLETICFCQSAGSFIINLRYVEKFFKIATAHKVKLKGCDKAIPAGRSYYTGLLKKMEDHAF